MVLPIEGLASLGALASTDMPADAVLVGRVGAAYGIHGWFHVHPYSAEPEALFSCRRWLLQGKLPTAKTIHKSTYPANPTYLLRILACKAHGDSLVAQAHDITARDQAEILKNSEIWIPRSSFPSLAEDEFYWVDLPGLLVSNREGIVLGRVESLLQAGPQTTLQIIPSTTDSPEGKTPHSNPVRILIPFVKQFIVQVDLAAQTMVVDWQADW